MAEDATRGNKYRGPPFKSYQCPAKQREKNPSKKKKYEKIESQKIESQDVISVS